MFGSVFMWTCEIDLKGGSIQQQKRFFIDFERRYPPGNDHISPPSMFESMIFRTSQVGICDGSLEGNQFIVLPDLIWIARALAIIQLKVPW